MFNPKLGVLSAIAAISTVTLSSLALPVLAIASMPSRYVGAEVQSAGSIAPPAGRRNATTDGALSPRSPLSIIVSPPATLNSAPIALPELEQMQLPDYQFENGHEALTASAPLIGITILLDPGHGGADPGAIVDGVQEKNVVLNVTMLLRDKLEALGATVDMTRDSDKTLTLQERLDAANSLCPDIFVSVHANSVARPIIRGIETYYYDSRDQKLSDLVLDTVSKDLNEPKKWSHARNLFVLDGNNVPATLVEIGYLTNASSRALLKTQTYQDKVASSLANSIVAYFSDPTAERGCPVGV